jgi:hypothetical protein
LQERASLDCPRGHKESARAVFGCRHGLCCEKVLPWRRVL